MSGVSMEFRCYSSGGLLTRLRAREREKRHRLDPPTGARRIAERDAPAARAVRLFSRGSVVEEGGRGGGEGGGGGGRAGRGSGGEGQDGTQGRGRVPGLGARQSVSRRRGF